MEENLQLESLQSLYSYLPNLINGVNEAVEHLRSQNENKALQLMPQIIEGLHWSISVIYYTKDLLNSLGMDIEEDRVVDTTTELMESVENSDYVLMADLLEYEVVDLLKKWISDLEKVEIN